MPVAGSGIALLTNKSHLSRQNMHSFERPFKWNRHLRHHLFPILITCSAATIHLFPSSFSDSCIISLRVIQGAYSKRQKEGNVIVYAHKSGPSGIHCGISTHRHPRASFLFFVHSSRASVETPWYYRHPCSWLWRVSWMPVQIYKLTGMLSRYRLEV